MHLSTIIISNTRRLVAADGRLLSAPRIECELRVEIIAAPSWCAWGVYDSHGTDIVLEPGHIWYARFAGNAVRGVIGPTQPHYLIISRLYINRLPWAPPYAPDADVEAVARARYTTTFLDGGAPRVREWGIAFKYPDFDLWSEATGAEDRVRYADGNDIGGAYRMDWTSDGRVTPAS